MQDVWEMGSLPVWDLFFDTNGLRVVVNCQARGMPS
jgi:hypothetical protein